MKKITIVLLLLSQLSFFAQDYKFGKVSKAEVEESFYPLDSAADAAYLYKSRKTYFDYFGEEGWKLQTEVVEKIKIYTKEGLEKATKRIAYYTPETGASEIVSSIKGYSYNLEDGKLMKQKLSSKNIFKEKKNDSWSIKKITLPKVKVGTVIELKYKTSSPYYTTMENVVLQSDVPIKKTNIEIRIPEYFNFKKYFKGYLPINLKESKSSKTINFSYRSQDNVKRIKTTRHTEKVTLFERVYDIQQSNTPSLTFEEHAGNISNYQSTLMFELSHTKFPNSALRYYARSWEDVSKKIHEYPSFGVELNKTSYYKNDLPADLQKTNNEFEKASILLQFVKSKVQWNKNGSKYTEFGVKKAYKEGVGNVADINLMLISMLRYAGLNANPVLVSTKANGVPLYPTLDGFNYVIAMVESANGKYVLLDATEPYSLPNILPLRALNWNGRKVTKDGNSSWVKLSSSKLALEENLVIVKIANDLTAEGLIRTKFDNLNALAYRKTNNHVSEENLIAELEDTHEFEIEDYNVLNKKVLGKPIVRNVKFMSEDLIEEINGKLYIEPMLFLTKQTNPFKLEERLFPVDFRKTWKDVNKVTIQIPEGYRIEALPESIAMDLPDNLGIFRYQVTQGGNKIKSVSILEFNASIIKQEYYTSLKDFYEKIVKKELEKIVLVKE